MYKNTNTLEYAHTHTNISVHKRTFTLIHTYSIHITHKYTRTHVRIQKHTYSSQVNILSDMHAHEDSSTFMCKHVHSHILVSHQHKYMNKHSRVRRLKYTHALTQAYTHKCTHKHKHVHSNKNACKHELIHALTQH